MEGPALCTLRGCRPCVGDLPVPATPQEGLLSPQFTDEETEAQTGHRLAQSQLDS